VCSEKLFVKWMGGYVRLQLTVVVVGGGGGDFCAEHIHPQPSFLHLIKGREGG